MLKLIALLLCGQEPAASITVDVQSPREVTLYEVIDQQRLLLQDVVLDTIITSTIAAPRCIAPCVVTVPRGKEYFVAAPGIPRSKSFTLGGEADRATLRVSPGDPLMRLLAKASVVAAVLLVGAGVIGVASGLSTGGTSRGVQAGLGGAGLALGVGVGITGLVLWFLPGSTRVLIE